MNGLRDALQHGVGRRGVLAWCSLMVIGLVLGACEEQGHWGKTEHRRFLRSIDSAAPLSQNEFFFALPIGVERQRFALAALESLRIGRGVRVEPVDLTSYAISGQPMAFAEGAFVSSLGELSIGSGVVVGSVYALGGPTKIHDRALLRGYLKDARVVSNRAAVPLLGSVTVGSEVEYIVFNPPETEPSKPASAIHSRVSRATDTNATIVAPGAYTALTLEAGSNMRFTSGTYLVNDLKIARDAILELDNSHGALEIWVRRHLTIDGYLEPQTIEPTILVAYAGTADLTLTEPFRGTLIAPRANLTLTKSRTPHVGAFFARRLTAEDQVRVLHAGFQRWRPQPVRLAIMCEECSSYASLLARACCDEFTLAVSDGSIASASCLVACALPQGCSRACSSERSIETAMRRRSKCTLAAEEAYYRCQWQNHWTPGVCTNAGYVSPAELACPN